MDSVNNLKGLEEQALLLKAREGSDLAVAELYLRYKDLIYGLCLKYFRNVAIAKDESAHIYEKLLKALKKHEVDNFKAWLFTLSRNHCLDILRTKNSKRAKIEESQIMYSEAVFHPDNVEDKEMKLEKLASCIKKLSAFQKRCIEMFYYEKMSYEEISLDQNLEWSQIRSYIQNGRRNLKNCMES